MPLGRAPENPYPLYICIYVQAYAYMHVCRRVQAHISVATCRCRSWISMKSFRIFINVCALRRSLIRGYSIQHPVDSTLPTWTWKPLLSWLPPNPSTTLAVLICQGEMYLLLSFSLAPSLFHPASFLLFSALSCRGHPHALLRRIASSWGRAISAKHAQPSTSMGQLHCSFLHILHCRKRIFNFLLLHFQTWRIYRGAMPTRR